VARKRYTRAQQLRDPAKRSKLPMSALTPAQQTQRRARITRERDDRNPLYRPSATLSGHDLVTAANRLAGTELDPQIASVGREADTAKAQSGALISRAGGYYRQLAEREAGNVAKQQALGDLLSKQLASIGTTTRADYDKQSQGETQRRSSEAAVRGDRGTSSQVDAELAALRGRSDTLQQGAESAAAAQTANYTGLQGAMSSAMALRGQEETGRLSTREQNTLAELAAKKADLEGQRGGLTTKHLLDLRQSGFENAATMQGLGLKAADIEATVAKASGDRSVARERIRSAASTNAANRSSREKVAAADRGVARERLTETQRHNREIEKGTPAKQKNESAASLKMRQDISAARGTWRRLMAKFHGDERHVKAHMIEAMGVPPAAYNAIYDLERTGALHPVNARALENDLGVMVPAGWRRKGGGKSKRPPKPVRGQRP
jgi:hypothetical protein